LWLGLARTEFDRATRVRTWFTSAVVFTAWLGLAWWLAVADAFRAGQRSGVPAIPFAIFLPVLLGLAIETQVRRLVGWPLGWAAAAWAGNAIEP
jgi:hypothetical protein